MPSRKDRPAAPAVKREAEEDWGGKRKASMTEPRRFPPPWTVEDHNDASFILKDYEEERVAERRQIS